MSSALQSCLYRGWVMHHRWRPRTHRFQYQVCSWLVDLDELTELDRLSPWLAVNRWAPFSFHEADHGDGSVHPLRVQVERLLAEAGLAKPARIKLLCYPRIWGYVFNPISIYFCEDEAGQLLATLHEVNNTLGERHLYLIDQPQAGALQRQQAGKRMYVSPFTPMQSHYRFRIQLPDSQLRVGILQLDEQGPLLHAQFYGQRVPLSSPQLRRQLMAMPLMTLKVIAAIHWQALRLWWKGVPVFRHQASRPWAWSRGQASVSARESTQEKSA